MSVKENILQYYSLCACVCSFISVWLTYVLIYTKTYHMAAVFMFTWVCPANVLSGAMGGVIKSADHRLLSPWIHYSLKMFQIPCISTYPNRLTHVFKDAFKLYWVTEIYYACSLISIQSLRGLLDCAPTEKHWYLFKNVLSSSLYLGHLNYHHFPFIDCYL